MKIVIKADKARFEKYMPAGKTDEYDISFFNLEASNEEILEKSADADVIVVDAIGVVDAELINAMPNLKLIHSEGVGFDKIDTKAAVARNIPVCNNKGINAASVAEHVILLSLALLRNSVAAHLEELNGKQIELKQSMMIEGIKELGDCTVGLVGFGDIAKETAIRLNAFGCKVFYWNRNKRSDDIEKKYNVIYKELDELLAVSDIVSIHVPVTKETKGMVNEQFLDKMKESAYLVNTARGEMVDNEALKDALIKGKIAGAGLDTIAPEPTPKDHILFNLPKDLKARVIFSPHIAGISTGTFKRSQERIWKNIKNIETGVKLENVVNMA
ncbi:MAG: hydroxyacid dehydrogenase [Lachnospiraceae bacterium]|nr:hydroxyacid dehydrogenase [Lachnospiraceae bacterium]